jgi:hypothetical protein
MNKMWIAGNGAYQHNLAPRVTDYPAEFSPPLPLFIRPHSRDQKHCYVLVSTIVVFAPLSIRRS